MVCGYAKTYAPNHRGVAHKKSQRMRHRSLKGKKEGGSRPGDKGGIDELVDSGEDAGNIDANPVETRSPTLSPAGFSTAIPTPNKDHENPPGTDIGKRPTGSPSLLESYRPSMMPSIGPMKVSDSPSPMPTFGPSLVPLPETTGIPSIAPTYIEKEESNPEPNDQPQGVGTLTIDPSDPLGFVCGGESERVTTTSGEIFVPFIYELWLEDSSVNFGETLSRVEAAMTRAVAEALLGCANRRTLIQQIVTAVSSAPEDIEYATGGCSDVTGCHRMDGRLTLETLEATGQEEMEIVCGALQIIQDSVAGVAATTWGVGGIRYEESTTLCGDMTDSIQGDIESKGQFAADSSTRSTLGGGATVAIALVGLVVFATGLFVARRRRKFAARDAVSELPCKDMMSLQLSYTNSSSPRTGFFGGASYTILADIQSMGSADPNVSLDQASSAGSPQCRPTTTDNVDADLFGSKNAFLFPMDAFDLQPDRLSLHSSEGGFTASDQDEVHSDSGSFTPYATPAHLMQHQLTPPKGDSPPSGFSSLNDDDDDLQEKKVSSPGYPGLSSLLGQASDSEGTDDDRSVVQFLDGGVSILKMSHLEGTPQDDSTEDDIHLV